MVRVVAERGAEPLHGSIQTVFEVNECSLRPETLRQLLARDHVARSLEHHAEDFERLLLEPDAFLPFPQLAGAHVELE